MKIFITYYKNRAYFFIISDSVSKRRMLDNNVVIKEHIRYHKQKENKILFQQNCVNISTKKML